MKFMIGQRVIFTDMVDGIIVDVICTVCTPDNGMCMLENEVWIDNPARRYKHWTSPDNVRPLPGGKL